MLSPASLILSGKRASKFLKQNLLGPALYISIKLEIPMIPSISTMPSGFTSKESIIIFFIILGQFLSIFYLTTLPLLLVRSCFWNERTKSSASS